RRYAAPDRLRPRSRMRSPVLSTDSLRLRVQSSCPLNLLPFPGVRCHQAQEAPVRFIPFTTLVMRLVHDQVGRCANDLADIGEGAQVPVRDGLDKDVTHGSGLNRPGDDLSACGVSGELAERLATRTAADHVDDLDLPTRVRHDPLDHPAVLQCEALEDASGDLGNACRGPLSRSLAVRDDASRHVAGSEKYRIVRVDEEGEWRCRSCFGNELLVRGVTPLIPPGTTAFLEQP